MYDPISIPQEKMVYEFNRILISRGFKKEKALQCAEIFTANSIDGVYSHGVNRFAAFIKMVDEGYVEPNNFPVLKNKNGGVEQWDGNSGPGPLNAMHATDTAIDLSKQYGLGCVALANTNHWMRGGAYGWHAAKRGFIFIGWTNTIANMPAWGATDSRLGNNPLVIAMPFKEEAIVLDMALSQYSFGSMELAQMKNEKLGVDGGYDVTGNLTNDPGAIVLSRRPLPVGYWKGAGLALLLDILATVLSGGLSTAEVSKDKIETAVSQVFIAINIAGLAGSSSIPQLVENIINDYKLSLPAGKQGRIIYPGERVLKTRKKNLADGIPVISTIWEEIMLL